MLTYLLVRSPLLWGAVIFSAALGFLWRDSLHHRTSVHYAANPLNAVEIRSQNSTVHLSLALPQHQPIAMERARFFTLRDENFQRPLVYFPGASAAATSLTMPDLYVKTPHGLSVIPREGLLRQLRLPYWLLLTLTLGTGATLLTWSLRRQLRLFSGLLPERPATRKDHRPTTDTSHAPPTNIAPIRPRSAAR